MARYIDADNFRKTMIKRFGCIPCLTDYSEASRNDIPIYDALGLSPTADVGPKSEVEMLQGALKAEERHNELTMEMAQKALKNAKADVAREIFAEIAEKLEGLFDFFRQDDCIRESCAITLAISEIAELKKKYTEGEPNG